MRSNYSTITMAVSDAWGPLNPPQQSTYVAAVILSNVFESLVQFDPQGNLQPALALSWNVSPDFTRYEFAVDTTRRFSDGTYVTAPVIKRGFEDALRAQPGGHRQSSLDLLYQVVGFEQFETTGTLSGIETPSDDHLVITFGRPFRQALAFLAGVRYSAYHKNSDNQYVGTGPYRIAGDDTHSVLLRTNPFAKGVPAFPQAKIFKVAGGEWKQAICAGTYDVFWSVSANKLKDCGPTGLIAESGAVASHLVLELNGMKGEFFEDSKMRQALQYLVLEKVVPKIRELLDGHGFITDMQFMLPLQVGRLSPEEAEAIVNGGAPWVPELIARTQERPLRMWQTNDRAARVIALLEAEGIKIKTSATRLRSDELFAQHYRLFDYDLLLWSVSMGGLDPDGLYHYLGAHGAIGSPPVERASVMQILESGRSLIDQGEMETTYKELSRVLLRDVPAVHFGFYRAAFLHSTRVVALHKSVNSYRFNLSHFVPAGQE